MTVQESLDRIKNYNVSVKEVGGKIIFLRKLKEGGSEHSFGINVASLAGMPKEVVLRASEMMHHFETNKFKEKDKETLNAAPKNTFHQNQGSLFGNQNDPALEKMKDELLALDNELSIVEKNIAIQENALEIVRLQKQAAEVNELAVKRFEAQVLNTKSLQYGIQQEIIEAENQLNFLVGRFPQKVARSTNSFNSLIPNAVTVGLPAQMLDKRPDIKQAEMELAAAKLDVKIAKARFYPSLGISAGIGFQAFNPSYLLEAPESMIYSLVGDIAAPLINRSAIKASYNNASAKQLQAVFNYERTILNAYIEIANQLANIDNLSKSYDLKKEEVETLTASITIANNLFKSARADYMEVLLTQRESLESKFELVETKKQQMNAMVNVYKALGGGWN